jgi:hypothetical protein
VSRTGNCRDGSACVLGALRGEQLRPGWRARSVTPFREIRSAPPQSAANAERIQRAGMCEDPSETGEDRRNCRDRHGRRRGRIRRAETARRYLSVQVPGAPCRTVAILDTMRLWCRVGAGLVLLLTMFVSPIAPVLCALSCLEPGATTHRAPAGHDARASAPKASASCHEDAAAAPAPGVAESSTVPRDVIWHPCQHPAAATSSAQPHILRLPQPVLATSVAPYPSAPILTVRPPRLASPARTPLRQEVQGFSLALRI